MPDRPAGEQRPPVEPARVEADHDRRQRLQDPDAAEQLQVDRELLATARARTPARRTSPPARPSCSAVASCCVGRVAVDERPVDVAGPQVRRRDRHDRRRHQRADHDRGERDAGEPRRELVLEQLRHRLLRVGRPSRPAAIATKPSRASSPSRKEYAGSSAALRRITERFRVESTPVTECGYMNSASAEPSASDA